MRLVRGDGVVKNPEAALLQWNPQSLVSVKGTESRLASEPRYQFKGSSEQRKLVVAQGAPAADY